METTRDSIRTSERRLADLRDLIESTKAARWSALRARLDTKPYDGLVAEAEAEFDAEHARFRGLLDGWER